MADNQFLAPGTATTDAFGFETAAGANARVRQRFAQRRAEFFKSGASNNHGRQVGQAFADIFGAPVRRALDTAAARKDERQRLIDSGVDSDTARATAKARLKPMFAEERRAQQLQQATAVGQGMIDDLIEQGVAGDRARAVGMLNVARDLERKGFRNEATQMRSQASELMQAQAEREATLANLNARTRSSEVTADVAETGLSSDDDTFVKFDEDGNISNMRSVAVGDTDIRNSLREQDYINVGNSLFGVELSQDVLAGFKPPPVNTQESLIAGISMMSGLQTLENVSDQTGLLEGPARALAARFGLEKEGFIDAVAVADKMRADIQSLIKGIPSNYDAQIFEKLIPDPRKAESTPLYKARVRLLRDETSRMLEMIVGFHKGTDKAIPEEVIQAARAVGVDIAGVESMTEEEFGQATAAHQRLLEESAGQIARESLDPDAGQSREEARASLMQKIRNRQNQGN